MDDVQMISTMVMVRTALGILVSVAFLVGMVVLVQLRRPSGGLWLIGAGVVLVFNSTATPALISGGNFMVSVLGWGASGYTILNAVGQGMSLLLMVGMLLMLLLGVEASTREQ
ncbi:MAG: hypothetical protein AAFS10_00940 [Myxococcota bacterium]